MKIAYFSPLSPIKSGISMYSENNLIPYLKKYADVDVFVEENIVPTNSFIKKNVPVFSYKEFNEKNYDVILYHIGNSPHHEYIYKISLQYPGVVVLHDAFIGSSSSQKSSIFLVISFGFFINSSYRIVIKSALVCFEKSWMNSDNS